MTVLDEILEKGEVEPELLRELTDEQKIVLFYKIRQEQIKRWNSAYNNTSESEWDNRKPRLDFLRGSDGNEWVWVMGDAEGDMSYDQVWMKYALENAQKEIKEKLPEVAEAEIDADAISSAVEPSEIISEILSEVDVSECPDLDSPPALPEEERAPDNTASNTTETPQVEPYESSIDNSVNSSSENGSASTQRAVPQPLLLAPLADDDTKEDDLSPVSPTVAKFPQVEDSPRSKTWDENVDQDDDDDDQPFPVDNSEETPFVSVRDRLKMFDNGPAQPMKFPSITAPSYPSLTRDSAGGRPWNSSAVPVRPNMVSGSGAQNRAVADSNRNIEQFRPIMPPSFRPTYSPTVTKPSGNFPLLESQQQQQQTNAQPAFIKTNPHMRAQQLPTPQPRQFSSLPVQPTPPNQEKNLNSMIDRQNAAVRRIIRQSILQDETDAISLQAEWEERERKAKEEEERHKLNTRKWQEMARRVVDEQLPVPLSRAFCMGKDASAVPHSRQDVIAWFQRSELPRQAGCDPATGAVCLWFHGIIPRDRTEALLRDTPVGSFLIRVSEKIYGYTLSYRAASRCKHFLIDPADGFYQFYGLNMKRHSCLFHLVQYHTTKPVSASGMELLQYPVGQMGPNLDFAELFQRSNFRPAPGTANSFQQNTRSSQSSSSSLSTQL